jgi:hypothetical protein
VAKPDPALVEFVKALARANAARDFAKACQAATERTASMTDALHHHRKILERAAEDNPNNARVPRPAGKGYRECVERGWIEERTHPHAGYPYFAITDDGKVALATKLAPKPRTTPRLKMLPDHLTPTPPRIRAAG